MSDVGANAPDDLDGSIRVLGTAETPSEVKHSTLGIGTDKTTTEA